MVAVSIIRTKDSQKKFFDELVAPGLEARGVQCHLVENSAQSEIVLCWGWRVGLPFHREGRKVLVFERGYLGDRFHWTSIGWNGLNARADFCLPDIITADRFEENHAPLKPWKQSGSIVTIMGQVRGDMSLAGRDLTLWYEEQARAAEQALGLPVYFRPHPAGIANNRNFQPDIPLIYGDLPQVLDKSALVIAYNSNSGVDAVINGVPSVSADHGSMAWEVTSRSVHDIVRGEREPWVHALAHCQWTPEEIRNADYWDRFACRLAA